MIDTERETIITIKRDRITAKILTTDPFYLGLFDLFRTRYPNIFLYTGEYLFEGMILGKYYEVPKSVLRLLPRRISEKHMIAFLEEHKKLLEPAPEETEAPE